MGKNRQNSKTYSTEQEDGKLLQLCELIAKLDWMDLAEIRGTVKGMLKEEKYKKIIDLPVQWHED